MRILVKFSQGTPLVNATAVHARNHGQVIQELPQIGVVVVEVPNESDLRNYRNEVSVQYAELDGEVQALDVPRPRWFLPAFLPQALPNDPLWGQQWGPIKVKAADAWDISRGDPGDHCGHPGYRH